MTFLLPFPRALQTLSITGIYVSSSLQVGKQNDVLEDATVSVGMIFGSVLPDFSLFKRTPSLCSLAV